MNDFTATIREDSERASDWINVFGSRTIPLVSAFPERANAPGITAGLFYQIDLRQITPEQRARMVDHIARTFSLARAYVDATLDQVGCPILADDVSIAVRHPQRWI